jgi:hypothetical protein
LVAIRGQIKPCEAPLEEIGQIKLELQSQFEKFEEDKDKQKELNDEIGRKIQLAVMRENVGF